MTGVIKHLQEQRLTDLFTVECTAESLGSAQVDRQIKHHLTIRPQRNPLFSRKPGNNRENLREHMHMMMAIKMRRFASK